MSVRYMDDFLQLRYYLVRIDRFLDRGGTCSLGAPAPTQGKSLDSPLSQAIGRGRRNSK